VATWIYSQRAYKRKLERGEPSLGMTAERVAKLTALGLNWDGSKMTGLRGVHPDVKEVAWEGQLARLAAYKAEHGHCSVPGNWAEDPRLGSWVGNQRAYKRKLDRGEPSEGMTTERAAKLTAVGFIWDGGDAVWEGQLARLAAYKAEHGDCKVPRGWPEDPRLSYWVGTQQSGKKRLDSGEPGERMTAERAARLTALGINWL
jgi:hypothetical protein